MFANIIKNYNWNTVSKNIYSKTEADVEKALSSNKRTLDDFTALISPSAEKYIEQMAQLSQNLTQKRFGKTIQLYIPLYLSNICENKCVYCGFSANNNIPRKILSLDEVVEEAKAIKKLGYEHILLVTGEAPNRAGMDYLKQVFELIRPYFSLISIEVQPLEQSEYKELTSLGLNTVYIYQETYNEANYLNYHLGGKKADYNWRLSTPDRLGKAEVHKIGLGILAGLEDWRADSFFCALHLGYLKKTYWKTKYSISFPRLRPHQGQFEPNHVMTDTHLAQLIFAYRLLDENVEISLSTRESKAFRDNMMSLGVTAMSAGSKTEPGGYAVERKELEQFAVNDNRTPSEIMQMIRSKGYESVWKDWDVFMQK
jgi:2-iminoacetate synthase